MLERKKKWGKRVWVLCLKVEWKMLSVLMACAKCLYRMKWKKKKNEEFVCGGGGGICMWGWKIVTTFSFAEWTRNRARKREREQ